MSFDKNYPNRKDHRKPFYGVKAVSPSARNHGSDPVCEHNRTFDEIKNKAIAKVEINGLELELVGVDET